MGAALGLPFDEAIAYKKERQIRFGVVGFHEGEMRDLWKYVKIKHRESLRDVLLREYLTDFRASIALGAPREEDAQALEQAFRDPTYALSLGTSDDLVKMRRIHCARQVGESMCTAFENTILSGDKTGLYDHAIDLRTTDVTYTIRAPSVFLLPSDFTFAGDERRVSRRELFTFVGSPITLKDPISAYTVDEKTFEML